MNNRLNQTTRGGTMASKEIISQEIIEHIIYLIRGQRVMLDTDLAKLYQVTTFNLNKAVKRNIDRFPEDFMFQLSLEEFKSLRFQIGISKKGRGGRRYLPYAFSEQGVAMLSSVLRMSPWMIPTLCCYTTTQQFEILFCSFRKQNREGG
jgi:hypothetical protein